MSVAAAETSASIQAILSMLPELHSACIQLLQSEKSSLSAPLMLNDAPVTLISAGPLSEVFMHIKCALSIVWHMREASYPAVSMSSPYAVDSSKSAPTLRSLDPFDALIATGVSWHTSTDGRMSQQANSQAEYVGAQTSEQCAARNMRLEAGQCTKDSDYAEDRIHCNEASQSRSASHSESGSRSHYATEIEAGKSPKANISRRKMIDSLQLPRLERRGSRIIRFPSTNPPPSFSSSKAMKASVRISPRSSQGQYSYSDLETSSESYSGRDGSDCQVKIKNLDVLSFRRHERQ